MRDSHDDRPKDQPRGFLYTCLLASLAWMAIGSFVSWDEVVTGREEVPEVAFLFLVLYVVPALLVSAFGVWRFKRRRKVRVRRELTDDDILE